YWLAHQAPGATPGRRGSRPPFRLRPVSGPAASGPLPTPRHVEAAVRGITRGSLPAGMTEPLPQELCDGLRRPLGRIGGARANSALQFVGLQLESGATVGAPQRTTL